MNSRAYPSADIRSDHQLLIANIRLKLKAWSRHTASKRYDTKKLSDPLVAINYQAEVAGKLTPVTDMLTGDAEGCVNNVVEKMVDAFNNTSKNILGTVRNMPVKEWLSEDTWKLVQERRNLKRSRRESTDNRRHYNYLCREIKRRSQCDKDTYLRKICKGVEEAHMQKKTREIYDSVQKITGKSAPKVRIVRDKNGVVLIDQDKVKGRWKEHFCDLYNPKTSSDEKVLDECLVGGRSAEVCAGVMREEIEAAINRLKKNWSPGVDNISAEEIQAAGQSGVDVMFLLCRKIWEEEKFPRMWKQVIVVLLFKKKRQIML